MDQNEFAPQDIEKNKDLAALSYLWLFSLIVLLARRDSPFIQLHARQGATLFLLSIALWPWELTRYGEFVVLALIVLGFVQAVQGKAYRIPFIADLAEGKVRRTHFKKAWHVLKHTAIKIVKPEHITPAFREELKEEQRELSHQEHELKTEKDLIDREEKKLSSLLYRMDNDEKELHELEDEVHQEFKELEEDIHRMEKKVDEVLQK